MVLLRLCGSRRLADLPPFGGGYGFADFREAPPIFEVLVRLFVPVFRVQGNALGLLQDFDSDTFPAQQLFVSGSVGDIPYDYSLKLPHVNEGCADIAWTEGSEHGCSAEIEAAGIADGGSFAVVIRMVLLDQCVMALAKDAASIIINDHPADGGAALLVSLVGQQKCQPHEVLVAELAEESVVDDFGQALGGQISNRVQHLIADGSILCNERLHGCS